MYTFKTRVTNLTKHARRLPWLGIPTDWFGAGETKDVAGVYPLACLSRKGQFEYEVEHGMVSVSLITNMPVTPADTPLPEPIKHDIITAPAPPKPPKPTKKVTEKAAEPPKKVPSKPQKPLVHPNSGIQMKPPAQSVAEAAQRDTEPPGLPPATSLFPAEKHELKKEPDVTITLGDSMSADAKKAEEAAAKPAEKPAEEPAAKTTKTSAPKRGRGRPKKEKPAAAAKTTPKRSTGKRKTSTK